MREFYIKFQKFEGEILIKAGFQALQNVNL